MLPRADDNRKVNVSRKRRHKKRKKEERENNNTSSNHSRELEIFVKEAQVYLVFNSGACKIRRGGIHYKSERSRQMM
jgi:hypothetical protein